MKRARRSSRRAKEIRNASDRAGKVLNGQLRDERPGVRQLLKNIQAVMPSLEKLLKESSDHWTYEDGIYRFYHPSWKVYWLQERTLEIAGALERLAPWQKDTTSGRDGRARSRKTPRSPLNPWFLRNLAGGTTKELKMSDNDRWLATTRPIVEAFFHARYFLEMVVKYGKKLKSPPAMLPSGWASVLYLYNMR